MSENQLEFGVELSDQQAQIIAKEVEKFTGISGKHFKDVMRTLDQELFAIAVSRINSLPLIKEIQRFADPELCRKIGLDTCISFLGAPIYIDDETHLITVAVANPADQRITNFALRQFPQYTLQIVVSPVFDLKRYFASVANEDYSKEAENFKGKANEEKSLSKSKHKTIDLEQRPSSENQRIFFQLLQSAISREASDLTITYDSEKLYYELRIHGVMTADTTITGVTNIAEFDRLILQLIAKTDVGRMRHFPRVSGRFHINIAGRRIDTRYERLLLRDEGFSKTIRFQDPLMAQNELGKGGLTFNEKTLSLIRQTLSAGDGLILITGPTGSGKSTTLGAFIREINHPEDKIISIESPVEFVIPGVKQCEFDDEKELEVEEYLRGAMRSDPDIIYIQEIRDPMTAKLAYNAALTGHLVLASLHSRNAFGAIARMNGMGVTPNELENALLATSSQRLVKQLCKDCKKQVKIPDGLLKLIGEEEEIWKGSLFCQRGSVSDRQRCGSCKGTGYVGRKAALEFFPLDDEMRLLIANNKSAIEMQNFARAKGLPILKDLILDMVKKGETDIETAASCTGIYV